MRFATSTACMSILLLLLAPAEATHCATYSTSTTDLSARKVVIEIDRDDLFLDDLHSFYYDVCHPECVFSFGTYQESNGIPGLQRGDAFVDETCHGLIASDVWTL